MKKFVPYGKKKKDITAYFQFICMIFLIIVVATFPYKTIEPFIQKIRIERYENYLDNLTTTKNNRGVDYVATLNEKFCAWLSCDDVGLEVPILSTENADEEEYFMKHDFRNTKNILGSPYQKHDTTIGQSTNTVFVGHSAYHITSILGKRLDLLIFGKLNNYLNFNNNYNYKFKVETTSQVYNYEIFSVIKFSTISNYDQQYSIFSTTNINTELQFSNFYQKAKNLSEYDINSSASYGDKFITLFTCSPNITYRTMIIAKQI